MYTVSVIIELDDFVNVRKLDYVTLSANRFTEEAETLQIIQYYPSRIANLDLMLKCQILCL